MSVVELIKRSAAKAISEVYKAEIEPANITVSATKPEFEGDYTIVLFSLVKQLRKSPDGAGQELGIYLLQQHPGLFSS